MLRALRHGRSSKIYCPRCGSGKIGLSRRAGDALHGGRNPDYWLFPRKYECTECGYNGPVVMELEKDEG